MASLHRSGENRAIAETGEETFHPVFRQQTSENIDRPWILPVSRACPVQFPEPRDPKNYPVRRVGLWYEMLGDTEEIENLLEESRDAKAEIQENIDESEEVVDELRDSISELEQLRPYANQEQTEEIDKGLEKARTSLRRTEDVLEDMRNQRGQLEEMIGDLEARLDAPDNEPAESAEDYRHRNPPQAYGVGTGKGMDFSEE